jgi:hypothetical protein
MFVGTAYECPANPFKSLIDYKITPPKGGPLAFTVANVNLWTRLESFYSIYII